MALRSAIRVSRTSYRFPRHPPRQRAQPSAAARRRAARSSSAFFASALRSGVGKAPFSDQFISASTLKKMAPAPRDRRFQSPSLAAALALATRGLADGQGCSAALTPRRGGGESIATGAMMAAAAPLEQPSLGVVGSIGSGISGREKFGACPLSDRQGRAPASSFAGPGLGLRRADR